MAVRLYRFFYGGHLPLYLLELRLQFAVTRLKKTGFVILNMWLMYHVFAVFIAPAGMPPSSPLLVDISRAARPYNVLLFLNHGYHFFAPDPGESTLISFESRREEDVSVTGTFPDVTTTPRLLYHRYFMLAENIGAYPPQAQDEIFEAYARHFCRTHGTERVRLWRVGHRPSSIARIQAGGSLSDPETYREELIADYDFRGTADFRRAPEATSRADREVRR